MEPAAAEHDNLVLLKIQNRDRPDQLIYLIREQATGYFVTSGLRSLFGVKEIRIATADLIEALQQYAKVLAFLLESMSRAEELNLPYGYQNQFEFEGRRYSLHEEGAYRVLKAAVESW
jgi:hypothetical protein